MKTIRVALIAATVTLWNMAAHAQTQAEVSQLAREGRALSPQQVSDLEDRLKSGPDDLSARTRLLGYYFSSSLRTAGAEATRAARRRHILWVIEHHPEAEVTMLPEITIDPAGHPLADADAYDEVKKLWLIQIDRHKDEAAVLLHAARFFRLPDRALALSLLKQAVRVSPTDVNAAADLGYTFGITILGITMINNNGLPMNADPAAAAGALARQSIDDVRASSNVTVITSAGSVLAQFGAMLSASRGGIDQSSLAEELLKKAEALDRVDAAPARSLTNFYHLRWIRAQTPEERTGFARRELEQAELVLSRRKPGFQDDLYVLTTAGKAAVEAGALEKARQMATSALARVGPRNDNTTGQFIHDGHLVLGRVALRDGKIDEAKAHLLQAGKVTGGGVLTSFGPNMSLAKELFERGERDTVLSYLEECESFWSFRGIAMQWIQTIRRGGTPDFSANLIY